MDYSFDVEVAKQHGINEAIIIRHFQFWIIKNKANDRHFHDGRTWTYNSLDAFTKIFQFWTKRQIEKLLAKLRDTSVIVVGNYNSVKYDRTLWYAFMDESIYLNGEIDFTKRGNGDHQKVTPIPVNKPVNNTYTLNQSELIETFNVFYDRYPRKVSKPSALKSWLKIQPTPDIVKQILDALDVQKESDQWLKDNGQFIPHPSTWLNNRRWEDNISVGKKWNEA